MSAVCCAIWEKWIEFKDGWLSLTVSSIISPLLYLLAFGLGLGGSSADGQPYINYLVPGIIAISTMNMGFSSTSTYTSVQRVFEHSLDQVLVSPAPLWQYVLGQTIGGGLKSMYGGILTILLGLLFGVFIPAGPLFLSVMLINGMIFSAFGVYAALKAAGHAQVQRFSSYLILPMTFLCGTFFSPDRLPHWLGGFIKCLPLSFASDALRSLSMGNHNVLPQILMLLLYASLFYALALIRIYRMREL